MAMSHLLNHNSVNTESVSFYLQKKFDYSLDDENKTKNLSKDFQLQISIDEISCSLTV